TPQMPLASLQPPVTEARLKNGLKVLLQENHSTPLISVGCWYRVGSRDDPAGAAGLSNLARLLRLSEMEGPLRDKMGQLTRETGGDWHSMTLPDQTGFFETVPAGALEEVLKLEAARMSASAAIDDLQFRGQQRRAIAALRAREDIPRSLLDDEVAASALQRHPYRWPSIGWLPDTASIGPDDVARHSREHFVPNNAVLVLVGDFETRTALGLAEKYFGVVARRPDPRRIEVQEPERRGERRVRVGNEGAAPYLQIAFQGPEFFNDDFYAMLVLDAVLTGAQGMRHWSGVHPSVAKISSRLFQALVETGLAAEVRSRMVPRQAPSLYQLTLTLPDAFQFQAAEEAVLEQLERLKSQEVSDVELAKAKNLLVAGEFLAQDSVGKRAFQLGFFESVASHQVLNEFETKIATVKRDDLRRVATHYLSENMRTVGSFVPSAKRKAIEIETLSPSGSDILLRTPPVSQPALAPRELNLRTPSLQPVFMPGSVFDSPDHGNQQKGPESQAKLLAEIPTSRLPAPRPQRKVLPNGSTLIAAATVSGSTVTIRAGIKIGERGESDVATVVSAMLLRGTSARNQAPLAMVFDYLGAEVSSEISDGIATIMVRGLSKDCAAFLQLLAEMMQSPSFAPAEFDKVGEGL
ncbi:MAG TPA: insulinase family protein, partial [Terriglobia bacterium]|nr:insulinase family protein [Terriglobia bacterium]